MHGPINVKSPNNISEWQMGFNSAFKGLTQKCQILSCDTLVANERYVLAYFKTVKENICYLARHEDPLLCG